MSNSASTNSRTFTSRPSSSGVQRGGRDQRRMAEFIGNKEFHRPGGWADNKEEEYIQRNPQPTFQRKQRNTQRSTAWRRKPRADKIVDSADTSKPTVTTEGADTDRYQSTKTSPPKDDPLYSFTQGSRQFIKRRCQNLEHSSFVQLCDVTYRQLREYAPRIRREMPYTAFLHAMNTVLQAWLLDTARNLNQESRWQGEDQPMSSIPREMVIPAPIAEYLSLINTNITPAGDTVRVNIPDAIVPGVEVPANGDVPAQPAGTFGEISSRNHNAYEVNIAPYITMRNIQSQAQNQALTPLPDGLFPAGAAPTGNLLGHVPFIPVGPEARQQLQEYEFPEGSGLAARLRLCPPLMVDVSSTLHRLSDKLKMVKIQDLTRKPNVACTVYNRYETRRNGTAMSAVIAQQTPVISALFSFGTTTASQATIFGFKKERTDQVRGYCFTTANGAALPGWAAHINAYFTMTAPFGPTIDRDYAALRTQDALTNPEDDPLLNICADWVKKFAIR